MLRKRLILSCAVVGVILTSLASAMPAQAAEFYSGNSVSTNEELNNAYIAGGTVTITDKVKNDLTIAGGTVTIDADVEHTLTVAGGTVTVNGKIGQNARIAGGTVNINGSVEQDLAVFGGTVNISKDATINGDVMAGGSTLDIQGTVNGTVWASGNAITLNGNIGNVEINRVSSLTIGPDAEIKGDLTYTSPREAQVNEQAVIRGEVNYTAGKAPEQSSAGITTAGFFYNIIASLVFCLVLLFLFRRLVSQGVHDTHHSAASTLLLGLGALVFGPVAGLIALFLSPWLGITIILLFVMVVITGYFLGQLILGWWLLSWWFGRNQQSYDLDWRAIIIGVLTATILSIVPVLGWLILAGTTLIGIGSLVRGIWQLSQSAGPSSPVYEVKAKPIAPAKPEVTAATAPKPTTKAASKSVTATKTTKPAKASAAPAKKTTPKAKK